MLLNLSEAFNKLAIDLQIDDSTITYCLTRFKAEGIRFFTVCLPTLSKAVLASLEAGRFIRPTAFAWKGKHLRHFTCLTHLIFDQNGEIRPESDIVADGLYRLRQLCDYMYKLAFSFSASEIAKAEEKFASVDASLELIDVDNSGFIALCRRNFETYYLPNLPRSVDDFLKVATARFGPGSFAKHSRETSSKHYVEKMQSPFSCPSSMGAHKGFFKPYERYGKGKDLSESGYRLPNKNRVSVVSDEGKVSEVLFVSKDSRGPRVISREPKNNLQTQLAFFDVVTPALERATKGRINFESQDVNRGLVKKASIDRKNSTLDLKDGSDRVSFKLVCTVFRQWTGLMNLLTLSRSTHAQLPSGRVIRLNKVAGMGSGFTFPLMALLIQLSVATSISLRSSLSFKQAMNIVYVYGDDLIVPTHYVAEALYGLQQVGLEVNVGKSFIHSKFRESCGLDCYDGNEVVPVRLKLSNANLPEPSGVISLDDNGVLQLERHCRELVLAGLWNLSSFYYELLEQRLGVLPNVTGNTHALGRYVFNMALCPSHDRRVSVIVPVSPECDVKHSNPYRTLKSRLLPKLLSPLRILRPTKMLDHGIVSVPRSTKLVRRKLYGSVLRGLS